MRGNGTVAATWNTPKGRKARVNNNVEDAGMGKLAKGPTTSACAHPQIATTKLAPIEAPHPIGACSKVFA